MDIHIDEFNRDVALTLIRLYQGFPKPMAIYVDDISRVDEPDEYGVISDRHQRCLGALLWLADEGILRFRDTIGIEGIDHAVLSLATLQALHHRSPDNAQSVIEQIREAVQERSSEATKRCIGRLFSLLKPT